MTGAPVPTGADAVVPLEWTDGGLAARRHHPGRRRRARTSAGRGEDVHGGDLVLEAGTRLGPGQLGLLAAVGRDRVKVRPRPRVVILSTGSELVEPGTPTGSGQIHESNSYILTTAAREAGAIAFRVGIVPDDPRTADGHDRGPADPGRPGDHQRRGERRRLRRGQGGAVAARAR